MLSWIREKFGTVVIGGIIAFIAFVFVFYGVYSPKATRGLHEGSVAGTVNGDPITLSEFSRELNRRIEFYKSITGGQSLTEEQLKQLHIRAQVFQELSERKLMLQEALRQGLVAADDEVKDRIQDIPAFKKDGKFDVNQYRSVLEANNLSPGSFEKMMREDLSVQQWMEYFRARAHVSEEEIKQDYLMAQDKRNVRYVLITPESVKDEITVTAEEIKKFIADPTQANLVQIKFDAGKNSIYKGEKLEQVREKIARSILAENKTEQVQKKVSALADTVLELMTKNSGAPEAKLNALLKPHSLQAKSTGWMIRKSPYVPGFGESKDLLAAAFDPSAPLDTKKSGKPRKFQAANRFMIAWVFESETADLAKLDGAQRQALIVQMSQKKVGELFQGWVKKLKEKSKIEANPDVIQSDG